MSGDGQLFRERWLVWCAMTMGVHSAMSDAERAELNAWEAEYVDGSGEYGTSDWPGWLRYLSPPPVPPARPETLRAPKAAIPASLRREVMERDGYRCRECGDWHDLSVDHIYPESLGGETILENLQTLCRPCNSSKGVRVP